MENLIQRYLSDGESNCGKSGKCCVLCSKNIHLHYSSFVSVLLVELEKSSKKNMNVAGLPFLSLG